MKLPTRACIVCSRPIKKRTTTVHIKPTEGFFPHRCDDAVEATIRTRAECRRYTNAPYVLSHHTNNRGLVISFETWDGESFMDEFFCTNRCAQQQGYASARHGRRYTWNEP